MAHVIKQGQYFLFRTKGINSKGMIHKFDFPKESSFDIDVNVTLVRSHSKKFCQVFQQTDIYALLIIILRLIILNMAAMALMSYLSVLYVFRLVNQHMNIL